MKLSNHTLLINMIIGLCKRTYGWPSTLKDLGYDVDWIEPKLINSEGRKVIPDLMLTSNKFLHSLVVECKGGKTLDKDQIDRLSKLTVDSVRDKASVYNARRLSLDVCFASFKDYLGHILQLLGESFPILVFSDTELKKHGKFKSRHLENALSNSISLGGSPPTGYVPFTDEDDIDVVAMYVIQELVSMALKSKKDDELKFDVDEVLSKIFPFWERTDEGAKKKLRNKVDSVIRQIILRKLKHRYLEKIKGRPTWVAKPLQAFKAECEKLLKDIKEQKRLEHFG